MKYIWIRRLVVGFLFIFIIFITVLPTRAVPASFDWGSFDSSGSTAYGVYDIDNVAVLETGDLIQFIWAGSNEVIDTPNCDGTPGGDDQLLDVNNINNGLPFPPPQQNKGYLPLETYSFDSENAESNGVVYLRAWNAAIVSDATAYGNSGVTTLEDGSIFNTPRWFTDIEFTYCLPTPEYFLYLPMVRK